MKNLQVPSLEKKVRMSSGKEGPLDGLKKATRKRSSLENVLKRVPTYRPPAVEMSSNDTEAKAGPAAAGAVAPPPTPRITRSKVDPPAGKKVMAGKKPLASKPKSLPLKAKLGEKRKHISKFSFIVFTLYVSTVLF